MKGLWGRRKKEILEGGRRKKRGQRQGLTREATQKICGYGQENEGTNKWKNGNGKDLVERVLS